MKNLSLLSFLSCIILWNGVLSGQAPFCKKILLGPVQKILTVPTMRATSDGNWLFPLQGNNFIGVLKMSPSGTILKAHRAAPQPTFNHNIWDVCELPNGDMLCIVEYDNAPGPANTICFLKCFTADFTEVWSRQIKDRGTILPIGANQFVITTYNQIIKINATGQVIWAKELSVQIQKAYALSNGNILVLLFPGAWGTQDLTLLSPEGLVLKSLDLPVVSIFGCYLDLFPGGDILVTYNNNTAEGIECQRLSPDLIPRHMWRITGPGTSHWPKVTVTNDSLIFFHWSTGEGPSSFLGTMDGTGNILKSVVLPFLVDYYSTSATLPNGATGWCGVSPMFIERGILVYSLDSSLTLPNSSLPIYDCLESNPIWVENLEISVTAVPATLGNQQYSVPWEEFSATIQDTCITYTIPGPFFELQDTLCVGTILVPDSVKSINASNHIWIINIDGNEADTLFSYAPELLFSQPGIASVLHQVHYLGCKTDTFSQTVLVLPAPSVDLGPDTSVCTETSFLINPIMEGADEWLWNDQDTSLQKEIEQPGMYFLKASNGICSISDTIEIKFGTANAAFGVVSGVCAGVFFTPVPVEMAASNHLWHWETPILPDVITEQPNFGISTPGTYQLWHTVTMEGCTDSVVESIVVVYPVHIEMPSLATICSDSILNIIPDTAHVLYFHWENGATTLERSIVNEGVFSFFASNEYCSDTASITVTEQVCEHLNIYIPNVFSPQANDANASFQVYYNQAVERVDLMEVYDRWGSLIFHASEEASWDGTIKGRPAAPGVYVYKVVFYLAEGGKTQRTGTVTLVR